MNFARRFNCNRCGVEKKVDKVKKQGIEIGSQAAEKSKVGEEIRQDSVQRW